MPSLVQKMACLIINVIVRSNDCLSFIVHFETSLSRFWIKVQLLDKKFNMKMSSVIRRPFVSAPMCSNQVTSVLVACGWFLIYPSEECVLWHVLFFFTYPIIHQSNVLGKCIKFSIETSYGDIDLGQYWSKIKLFWWYEAITWANVDFLQCIKWVLWQSHQNNFTAHAQATILCN